MVIDWCLSGGVNEPPRSSGTTAERTIKPGHERDAADPVVAGGAVRVVPISQAQVVGIAIAVLNDRPHRRSADIGRACELLQVLIDDSRQLDAGVDVELPEDVPQVVVDGVW